jgi:hypothetical protein
MDSESSGFLQTCPGCRRQFSHPGAFSNHLSTCKSKKSRITSALTALQQFYQETKKRRLHARDNQNMDPKPVVNTGVPSNPSTSDSAALNASPSSDNHDALGDSNQLDDRPIAERRPRRNIRMPARFLDQGPTGQAALPPISPPEPHSWPTSPSQGRHVRPRARDILKSPRNVFGLFRQYRAESFPSHDPDAGLEPLEHSDVLSDAPNINPVHSLPQSMIYPYPNENAFLLGEWFWDNCVQKSISSFNKLISIVSRPEFKPEDVRRIPWDSINEELGSSSDVGEMWIDEPDAGWTDTPITISVPFHRLTSNPGPQIYTVPSFRHRSIVSILKEKMANGEDFRNFHLEPYELHWQREDMPDGHSTRVHGELYTSPAFLEAYEEIQKLPGEPGCLLPRVLVGLMFGSDSTLLTSFGNATLWPCYMYFGNESKYRRSKPSCKLCNHIAYFQKVDQV